MAKVSPLRSRLRLRRRAKKPRKSSSSTRRWSAAVTQRSNALDLERNVFVGNSPSGIARSLKRSAERTRRRKSSAYRSAMLTFYINRAGKNLPKRRVHVLERAKAELRRAFGRD